MSIDLNITQELDARNLLCPMPVIKTQNIVKTLKSGDILKVVCTDPGTQHDIPTWCRINQHTVLKSGKDKYEYFFYIQVK